MIGTAAVGREHGARGVPPGGEAVEGAGWANLPGIRAECARRTEYGASWIGPVVAHCSSSYIGLLPKWLLVEGHWRCPQRLWITLWKKCCEQPESRITAWMSGGWSGFCQVLKSVSNHLVTDGVAGLAGRARGEGGAVRSDVHKKRPVGMPGAEDRPWACRSWRRQRPASAPGATTSRHSAPSWVWSTALGGTYSSSVRRPSPFKST